MTRGGSDGRERSLFDVADETGGSPPPPPAGAPGTTAVALHEAAQSRYLNYALSVITSRALPDVRDGLKPVQRPRDSKTWEKQGSAAGEST